MSENYNNFFNNVESDETATVLKPVELTEEDILEGPEPEIVEGFTEPEETEAPKPLYGINNCKKLNVRTEPRKNADIVCILDSANAFEIEELESDPEWVKVFIDNGKEGFCMKQYVAIK